MATKTYQWLAPRIVFGLGVVFVGLMWFLNNLGMVDASHVFRYWPALIILLGVTHLAQSCSVGGRIWASILIFFGTGMLLDRLEVVHFSVWDYWPLVFVFAGGSIIWGAIRRERTVPVEGKPESANEPRIHGTAIMSGIKRSYDAQEFSGGDLTAVMGGVELDLRKAIMKSNEAVLDVFVMWGGIELRVPEDWSVVVRAMPVMGGVEDATHMPPGDTGKRLVITGSVIMGGVELKN